MRRPLIAALALTIGWTLACSGLDDKPRTRPKPDPVEDPGPVEAPNAAKCKNVHGVSLPLAGGTITKCSPGKLVEIAHDKPRAKRWDYANKYKAKGWTQGDPVNNAPMVFKGADKIVFDANKEAVLVKIQKPPSSP